MEETPVTSASRGEGLLVFNGAMGVEIGVVLRTLKSVVLGQKRGQVQAEEEPSEGAERKKIKSRA